MQKSYIVFFCIFNCLFAEAGRSVSFVQTLALSNPAVYSEVIVLNISKIDQTIRLTGGLRILPQAVDLAGWTNAGCAMSPNCTADSAGWITLPQGKTLYFKMFENRSSDATTYAGSYTYVVQGLVEVKEDRGAVVASAAMGLIDSARVDRTIPVSINGHRPF